MTESTTARLRAPNGHTIPLPERRVTIGESPACDVPIARGFGLAAQHFRLQPWEHGHFLEDAGSGLGVLVNGHPVTWAPLKHGDRILAGELTLVYEYGSGPVMAVPVTEDPVVSPESPAPAPAPEAPPSWLPAEALLPPAPPPRWEAPAVRRHRMFKSKLGLSILIAAIIAAACLGLWLFR